jgi:hypothetical protein
MGGTPATGTVSLAVPAPSGGILVTLASNTPVVTVPSSVTVPAGSESTQFPVVTRGVATDSDATIAATAANRSVQVALAVWSEQPTHLSLWHEPSPGGFVIGRRFTPSNAPFITACQSNGLTVSVDGPSVVPTRVSLYAPIGARLHPGTYENIRFSAPTSSEPALLIDSPGIGSCNTPTARFVVHDAEFATGIEAIRRFSATFERRCGTFSIWGELRLTRSAASFGSCHQ